MAPARLRWLVVVTIFGLAAGCAGKPAATPTATPGSSPTQPRKPAARKPTAPAESDRRDFSRVPGVPVWQWESWDQHGKTQLVSHPEKYTLQLLADGWLKFSAECLAGEGIYETHDDRIVIALTQTAPTQCRPGPAAEQFIRSLEAATRYQQTASRLFLDLGPNGGGLSFSRSPN